MNLQKAQSHILKICQSGNQKEIWSLRTIAFLTALLPILAWPTTDVLRGNPEGLLDLEELVNRANHRTEYPEDLAWFEVRHFLTYLPGMKLSSDGALEFGNKIAALDHFGYIAMSLIDGQH